MVEPPKSIFLDQNKWIDLAHAFDNPQSNPRLFEIGHGLIGAIKSGRLQCPLTSNLIIETYKMSDDQHRSLIAEIQAQLSQGRVIRDRNFLIRHELARLILHMDGRAANDAPTFWWMSKYFLEAFVDIPRAISQFGLEVDQIERLIADPKFSLFHWLAAAPTDERELAMKSYESGSNALIDLITARIERIGDQTFSMRQRIYAAILAIDEGGRILSVANALDLNWNNASDVGSNRLRQIIRDVPTYHVEVALASRIESLDRSIVSNDLRDMQAYVAAIPCVDVLIGEKLFVNLAMQAGLGKRYGCELHTSMAALESHL